MTKNTTSLLSNSPIKELTEHTDFLNILDKGTLIKDFLIGSKENIKEINMYALYGDWGSGKSSLMKYLEKELRGEFNTFFFEAWKFEKDENLSISLLEFIAYKSNNVSEKFFDELVKYGGRILRGLAKSVKMNIPLFENGPSIEINPSVFTDEVCQKDSMTFFKVLEEFEKKFIQLEDCLTGDGKRKYNIVFIDDLDRCEPDQVLNLMSAIKLFFTYGEKTLFFCGIDKHAVETAVKTKYGDVVKSNEYLEKIFDISFTMPRQNNIKKLIDHYFDDTNYGVYEGNVMPINYRIETFFNGLEFRNPRKIKKVLNKFQILRDFSQIKKEKYKLPLIDMKDGSRGSYFETILVLYLIILHEFYPSEFDDFLNFEKKKDDFEKKLERRSNKDLEEINYALNTHHAHHSLNMSIDIERVVDRILKLPVSSIRNIRSFYICLFPNNYNRTEIEALEMHRWHKITVDNAKIDYRFYRYINRDNLAFLLKDTSDITMAQIKELIGNLL